MKCVALVMVTMQFSACMPLSGLEELSLVGGNSMQHQAAMDELEFFSLVARADDLRLREVVFSEIPTGGFGQYKRGTKRILLNHDLVPEDVRGALRHELCHALDHHAGWISEDIKGLEGAFERLVGDSLVVYEDVNTNPTHEAFAILCEEGPVGAQARAIKCGDDQHQLAGVSADVAEVVWRTGATCERRAADLFRPGEIEEAIHVLGYADSTVVFFHEGGERSYVDVATQELLDGHPGTSLNLVAMTEPSSLVVEGSIVDGWENAGGAGVAAIDLPFLSHPRLVVSTGGEAWAGCDCGDVDQTEVVLTALGTSWVTLGAGNSFRVVEYQ